MAFDGSYPRPVREAGIVHRIFVRRARCGDCGIGDALLPDFVLRGRRDSTTAVGAAVLGPTGVVMPPGAEELYVGVLERTVRSWRQRFAERAPELVQRFEALCLEWRGPFPFPAPRYATPTHHALASIGLVWRAACRRPGSDVPPAWRLANVITANLLLATRVDLPWPIKPSMIGRSPSP
jgi:hypothetical protein